MPDITMCKNNNCVAKATCFRYIAVPNEHGQSYFIGHPNKENNKCDYYMPYKDDDGYEIDPMEKGGRD